MGRPRKIPPPKDEVENPFIKETIEELAEYLSNWCGIPGCMGKNHIEEARNIKSFLERRGIKFVNG